MAIAIFMASYVTPQAEDRQPFDHSALAKTALERHIRPGYARLAKSAAQLADNVERHCLKPGKAGRKLIELAFDGFVSAWGRTEHIRFGPVTVDNTLERILFWPDRRGIGARQVSRTLARRDESVLDPTLLAGKSVAVQGLTALEQVLFASAEPKPVDPADANFRCRFATAIAANLARMTNEVSQGWINKDGFSRYWLAPGPGNPHFVLPTETTLALAKAFGEGLERVRDERIVGPLGLNAARRVMPAVLVRSRRTMRLVVANIEGLRDLLTVGGIKGAVLATDFKDPNIDVRANLRLVERELSTSLKLARQIVSAEKPFEDKQARRNLVNMGFPLKDARLQTGALLMLTANLAFGFNSSDGD